MKTIETTGAEFKAFVMAMLQAYGSVKIESFRDSLQVDGAPLASSAGCVAVDMRTLEHIADASQLLVGGFIKLGPQNEAFILQNAFYRWQKGIHHP